MASGQLSDDQLREIRLRVDAARSAIGYVLLNEIDDVETALNGVAGLLLQIELICKTAT